MKKNTHINNTYFLADWMENKISDQELKKLVSESDYNEYLKLRESFDILSELNKPLDNTLTQIKSKLQTSSNKKPKVISLYTKFALGIAASLLLFLGLYTKFYNQEIKYATGFGQQQTLALLDGSEVILNSNSILKYNKKTWLKNRTLFLEGEAYFKVTKGNKFTVNTKNGSVTVVGTEFNVNSRKDLFKVFCFEGKVRVVTKSAKNYLLTPNKGVVVLNNTEKEINLNQTKPSWLKNERIFNERPLKEVIIELENQFNIKIDKNNIDDSILFTGGFNTKNRNLALASVFKPLKIKYQIKNNTVKLRAVQH
jgi:ferric-dicitrate binding protein FerR (iron transport regulator)